MKDGTVKYSIRPIEAKVILNHFPTVNDIHNYDLTEEESELFDKWDDNLRVSELYGKDTMSPMTVKDIKFILKMFPDVNEPLLTDLEKSVFQTWIDNLTDLLNEYLSDNEDD